jgi:hypothetical protein
LASDRKTPLRESSATAPGRTSRTDTRSKVARRRAIVGGVLVLLIAGGGVFLMSRGGSGIGTILGHSEAPPAPVTFTITKATYEATVTGVDKDKQRSAAQTASKHVTSVLDKLFFTGYSDPSTWGDTGAIDDLFIESARDQVSADVNVLTLGDNAGDTYDRVEPGDSTVTVKTLTDKEGKAIRAFAQATFVATAAHDDGTYTEITVTGSFFFVPTDNGWQIEAYRVGRIEKPTKAPSPSVSASQSPSGGSS